VLAFLENMAAYGSGRSRLSLFPSVVLVDLSICVFVAVLAMLVAGLWAAKRPQLTEQMSTFVFVAAVAFLFALRGAGSGRVPRFGAASVLQWGIAVLVAVAALGIARRRSAPPLRHGAFLVLVGTSFSLVIAGFALQTVSSVLLLAQGERGGMVPLAILAAGGLAFLPVRGVQDSWPRVLTCALILTLAAGFVAYYRRPAEAPELRTVVAEAKPEPPAHSVLVITMDTTRRDRFSTYGYSGGLTPNLEKFADGATVFDNAYAPAPYTLSSHASLFTGLMPSQHRAHPLFDSPGRSRPLDSQSRTIAEDFAARGYQTGAIAANSAYLAKWTGLSRGFGAYLVTTRVQQVYYPLAWPLLNRFAPFLKRPDVETWPADAVTAGAIRWLEQSDSRPFFLFLNYMDVHQYLEREGFFGVKRISQATAAEAVEYRSAYDASIRTVDRALGRLLSWMSSRRTFDDTLIVITSDHGEYLGERALWGHGHELHENVLRVPLLVKFPGAKAPGRTTLRISHTDVHRLVVEAARGKSLGEIFPHPSSEPRVMAEMWQLWIPSSIPRGKKPWMAARAVYGDRWKLIEKVGAPSELYDLVRDPEESADFFVSAPETAARVAGELTASLPPIKLDGNSISDSSALSPETAEELRALGYVGP
jgi:arylsulfatase A-like enzyme